MLLLLGILLYKALCAIKYFSARDQAEKRWIFGLFTYLHNNKKTTKKEWRLHDRRLK